MSIMVERYVTPWNIEHERGVQPALARFEALNAGLDKLRDENAKLRELVRKYADSFERDAAMNGGNGPYYSGEDWLSLANDMRVELAEACGELGIEVER